MAQRKAPPLQKRGTHASCPHILMRSYAGVLVVRLLSRVPVRSLSARSPHQAAGSARLRRRWWWASWSLWYCPPSAVCAVGGRAGKGACGCVNVCVRATPGVHPNPARSSALDTEVGQASRDQKKRSRACRTGEIARVHTRDRQTLCQKSESMSVENERVGAGNITPPSSCSP